uniref:kelch-like protein 21 n=1 Tax=Myxine glutinosa TaxID=7769 RepID=UPI00358F6C89
MAEDGTLPGFAYTDPGHAQAVLAGLAALRGDSRLCDVVLGAGGREFPCHKAVLAASSHYFRAMFAGSMRESRQARVDIRDIGASALAQLLDYAYTGAVFVPGDGAVTLLQAADLLQFPAVKEACCRCLARQLDISNCLDMQTFAEAFSCPWLAEAAHRFSARHAIDVSRRAEFRSLPLHRIIALLSDDHLCVEHEESAFTLSARWIRSDPIARRPLWPELLEWVRLPFLRRFSLLAAVESEPGVHAAPRCRELLREARALQDSPQDRHNVLCPQRLRPRPSTGLAEVLVVLGGFDANCEWHSGVHCHNQATGVWRRLALLPQRLVGGYSIAALGNDIYVTGGWDGTQLFPTVWRYSSAVNEWGRAADMAQAYEFHVSVALGPHLYVVAANATQRYDTADDSWLSLRPLPQPMQAFSAAACRGHLYVIGSYDDDVGEDGRVVSTVILSYHPDTDVWTTLDCEDGKPEWDYVPITVALNGLIYLISHSLDVFAMDPAKRIWHDIPPMKQIHVGASVTPLGGQLLVSGGYNSSLELSTEIEAYDPATNLWSTVAHLPHPSLWHNAVSIFRQFVPPSHGQFRDSHPQWSRARRNQAVED